MNKEIVINVLSSIINQGDTMGICPACGSFINPGEPYCPDCGYIDGSDDDISYDSDTITIDGDEYDLSDVEDVLRVYGYELRDLEDGLIDGDDMELILDDLERI